MKRLAILVVALAIGLALSPASWKWSPHGARGDDAVIVLVTTAEGQQFVASTTAPQPEAGVYTADVVASNGTSYAGVTIEVLDPADVVSQGSPVTALDVIDSWSW
jgi:hypothetical protein